MGDKDGRMVEVAGTVPLAVDDAIRYFTRSSHLREWLADQAVANPRQGGYLFLAWDRGGAVMGRFGEIDASGRIDLAWQEEGCPPSRVEVVLREEEHGTSVALTHSRIAGGKGVKPKKEAKRLRAMWEQALDNLESVTTTGIDLRIARRPMLGLALDEVGEDRRAAIGLPPGEGLLVTAVVAGTGAESAGMMSGDVLVALDGAPVTGMPSVGAALAPRLAGDTVAAVVDRDGTRQEIEVTLSSRPMPEVPTTAEELAAQVAEIYDGIDAALREVFEGVSEDLAGRKPAPGVWSAKEVVAHLLDGEGDSHSWLTEVVQGAERIFDVYPGNSDTRVAITAWSYPTVAGMLDALRRLEEETVGLIAQLPDDFVARRSGFWRLAYGYAFARLHADEHIRQIREALASG